MTPAINLIKQNKIIHTIHEYSHQPNAESYGLEAAELLGVPADQIYKTLVIELDQTELAVAIIPVTNSLNTKSIAKHFGSKKALMANKDKVIRSTGYILGGVSPLAQKKKLKTVIDSSATNYSSIFVSGGKRGLEIELSPNDLANLCAANFASITQ